MLKTIVKAGFKFENLSDKKGLSVIEIIFNQQKKISFCIKSFIEASGIDIQAWKCKG